MPVIPCRFPLPLPLHDPPTTAKNRISPHPLLCERRLRQATQLLPQFGRPPDGLGAQEAAVDSMDAILRGSV
jgi:hypothetical protein